MSAYATKYGIFPAQIQVLPSKKLGIVVVIPCYNEPYAHKSLLALKNCVLPKADVEVILLINSSERAAAEIKDQNRDTFEDLSAWATQNNSDRLRFHILLHDNLPHKHAGVGLARKIGMDEACLRLEQADQADGILLCFDADSACKKNYLVEVEKHFAFFQKTTACSIHYEHPISGNEFEPDIYKYITDYELHLRYYVHALRYAGFPHAFQTIGSSMAVRATAYQKEGGMNRRKAGEDFYFLHKFIPSGHFSELKTTMVIPSPRPSDRVPFGTGRAVGKMIAMDSELYMTYNPRIFEELKTFLFFIKNLYETPLSPEFETKQVPSIASFLATLPFRKKVAEIRKHTANKITFLNRFYRWFNAFLVLKYVHHARDNFYADVEVGVATNWLFKTHFEEKAVRNNTEMLLRLREIDRG